MINNAIVMLLLMSHFILPISLSRARNLSCYIDQMKFTFWNYIIRYACNGDARTRATFGNFPEVSRVCYNSIRSLYMECYYMYSW